MLMSQLKQASIFAGLLATTITLNAYAFEVEQVQHGEQPYYKAFTALDKNANQTLSWSEAKADDSIKSRDFKHYDQDYDGSLTYDEYATMKTKLSQAAIKTTVADSWITTKAKAKLIEETSLKAFKISVETHQGEVLLSGFVSDPSLKAKAESVVSQIDGVKSVKNAIEISS